MEGDDDDDMFSSFEDSELEEDIFKVVDDTDDTTEWTGSVYEDG